MANLLKIGQNDFTPLATVIDFDEVDVPMGTENPVFEFTNIDKLGDVTVSFGQQFVGQTVIGTRPVTLDDTTPDGPLRLDLTQGVVETVYDGADGHTSPVLSGSPTFNGPIAVHFSQPVAAVGLKGGYFDALESTTIEVFDINGNSIGEIQNSIKGFEFYGLTTDTGQNLIAGLSFYITGNEPAGFEIDDITFGAADTVVVRLPTAGDDSVKTAMDQVVTIPVLNNDIDPNGDALSVLGAGNPSNGAVVVNADNTITYTPDSGFIGEDSFVYTLEAGGDIDTATVTVTVTDGGGDVETAPDAVDDAVETNAGESVAIFVLQNDSDPNGDVITIDQVFNPQNGTVSNDDGVLTYTPNEGFSGKDTFNYSITDGKETDSATVTVTVQAPEVEVRDYNAMYILTDESPSEFYVAEGLAANVEGEREGKTLNIANGAAAGGLARGSTVNLEGASEDYTLVRNGTTLEVRDGNDALAASLNVSPTVLSTLRFKDGATALMIESGKIALGGQFLVNDGDTVAGADLDLDGADTSVLTFTDNVDLPESPEANAYLVLMDTSPREFTLGDGLVTSVLGGTKGMTIFVPDGAGIDNVSAGTTLAFEGEISDFRFTRTGTTMNIRDAEGNLATNIKVVTGTDSRLIFADGAVDLGAVDKNLVLGGFAFTEGQDKQGNELTVDPSETSEPLFGYNLNGGTPFAADQVDAGTGAFDFKADVDWATFTNIANFGDDDTLEINGVTYSGDVEVRVASGNTILSFDNGKGIASEIQFVGVSGDFFSVESFNKDPNFGNILLPDAEAVVTNTEYLIGGNMVSPVQRDAAGAVTFVDQGSGPVHALITNFGADDTLKLPVADLNLVSVNVTEAGAEFEYGLNNSVITLQGVTGSFFDVADFNGLSEYGDVIADGGGAVAPEPAEPVIEPGEEPVIEPGEEPVIEPGEEPVIEPGEEPVIEPGEEPVIEPGEEPVTEPGEEPVTEPEPKLILLTKENNVLDAGAGAVIIEDPGLLDQVNDTISVEITNFGADDSLRLAADWAAVSVSVSSGNTYFEYDNGTEGVLNIELTGVAGFFTSVEEFNASPDYGDVLPAVELINASPDYGVLPAVELI
ncbi:Ig-like domain-containing protein [Thiorhodovibrio frisius]|uniref:Tandem-95 repeat protein n=1 Tax=Thiorhodovibrio frisius TaxID=631362 RepID=H8YWX9_9GAMM|nr:Ig-like domain-containing protein [Thiorhodovibrio frisius]EIC22955.1 hypothetical protein Thi970DRAFT_00598 [Thiorhodovibrio frisius]WPL22782.1 hypothetical protein Thiofri_02956 [Thiorhodovibrio frisius]